MTSTFRPRRLLTLWIAVALTVAPLGAHAFGAPVEDGRDVFVALSLTCLDPDGAGPAEAEPFSQHIACSGCVPGCCAGIQALAVWHRVVIVHAELVLPGHEPVRRASATHNKQQARSPPSI